MTTITENNNIGDLLKYEAPSLYSRKEVTVVAGQDLAIGMIVSLDKNDQAKQYNPTIADEIIEGVAISETVSDKTIIIARHAIISDHAIIWPAKVTEAQQKTITKSLENKGIIIRRGI